MSVCRYIVGDTRDVTATLPDGSVDLVMTSPPFLALRSYLPADHPDKWREIGSEATPAEFIDVLLALTAEWGRVLAPHGSICVELGDTYSGSGGAGGDYGEGGLREGQTKFRQSGWHRSGKEDPARYRSEGAAFTAPNGGPGWPLAKSKALIPELYRIALAYGINPLTGAESPAGRWRVRNVVTWCRPNPPVGALGDKYRPATSDMVIACRSDKRWFDLDAVRNAAPSPNTHARIAKDAEPRYDLPSQQRDGNWNTLAATNDTGGAPPLDYWVIPPGGYSGKTTSTRRVPCGPDDGGERTTSADCPVHGDRPAPAPTARRDAHGDQSSDRTPRTDDRPFGAQRDGSEPTDGSLDRSGSSQDPTTDSTVPRCSPAATPHSTTSSRTDRAPATTPPGTPSAETAANSVGTSGSPAWFEQRLDIDVSSISSVDSPDLPSRRTSSGSADTEPVGLASSSACTCSFTRVITESTSHYAVYPPELCRIPIESMCPRRVCTVCGEPSRRVVGEAEYVALRQPFKDGQEWGDLRVGMSGSKAPASRNAPTLGWTDCGHDSWRNGITFDPFGGSGTTGMVATGLGRDALLIDIDERNVDLTRERIGMFLEVDHFAKDGAA